MLFDIQEQTALILEVVKSVETASSASDDDLDYVPIIGDDR